MNKYLQNIGIKIYLKINVVMFITSMLFLNSSINRIIAQEYQLVWSDEFDSSNLDISKWEYQIGNGSGGWGNNEKEYYRPENAVIGNGYLTIVAKKENYNGYDYTSARIRTIHKGDWKYGKIEMRAKMPIGQGIWPAFWMMPTDNVYGGWAASGEIDIMEYLGNDSNTVYGTLHYGGAWPNNVHTGTSYSLTNGGFNNDFHIYTLIWEEGKMQWFVDGKLYQTQTNWYTSGHSFPAPFDQQFHIILNLAVGGNWPGYPDSTTQFPQEYTIDYVRVYQQNVTGIKETSKKPNNFYLNQNYPNPFNPSTTIEYSIPLNVRSETPNVKLVVYDVLGKQVATLVNKYQRSGNYKVEFNAENLPAGKQDLSSGIYYYQLKAGDFIQTKKMILLK